jgi:hypothetical protein
MGLTIRRGDDEVIFGRISNRLCQPVDISGWKIWFSVKRRWPDPDSQAVMIKTNGPDLDITDPLLGEFEVYIRQPDFADIPNAERTLMLYDVQIKKNPGGGVKTLGQGDFTILGDITFAVT